MPVYRLTDELWFPGPEHYDQDIVAVGGDLSLERLVLAYSFGIFPWYNDSEEILWWCPDPRCVLQIGDIIITKSMRNILNRNLFEYTFDESFVEVISRCRNVKRKEEGTWIHDEVVEAYSALHNIGLAHSVEVWHQDKLVGGLYGVSMGKMFFGESMFSDMSNASKAALIFLHDQLQLREFNFIDCQVYNDHLGSLGARTIDRKDFLNILNEELQFPTLKGVWNNMSKTVAG